MFRMVKIDKHILLKFFIKKTGISIQPACYSRIMFHHNKNLEIQKYKLNELKDSTRVISTNDLADK